jgi:hypothetical protein
VVIALTLAVTFGPPLVTLISKNMVAFLIGVLMGIFCAVNSM